MLGAASPVGGEMREGERGRGGTGSDGGFAEGNNMLSPTFYMDHAACSREN